ncbi:hypothetical protein DFH08DRAFT_979027 [Mycena albidolilacea]|uniref:Uncharacterized protein n=1 Tax=Mycena albidolilacea TaxID=1033008 RepID=A0AAD6YYF4_9AGAR|nr:hypothetical protein DFH08DRAFT_979027 [Mycena albidolilacea]
MSLQSASLETFQSKDAVVNLWEIPGSPSKNLNASPPSAPRRLDINFLNKRPDSDLTALHWNAEGTRLAIGSCDSILRGLLRAVFPALSAPGNDFNVSTAIGILNPTLNPYRREASHLCCHILAPWKVAAYGQSGLHRLSVGRDMKARKLNMQYRAHTGKSLPRRTAENLSVRLHTYGINQIRCNPSGTRLASCSDDMTACIWTVDAICAPSTGESTSPGVLPIDILLA